MEIELGLFERMLLATDGTVTDLIAVYAGDEIRVRKLHQAIDRRMAPPELHCDTPARLLNRRILLTGTTRTYLFADSLFVFDRFSKPIQEKLLNTDTPIGLLWKEARLETFREITAKDIQPCPDIAPHFAVSPDAPFVSRTYLIQSQGLP